MKHARDDYNRIQDPDGLIPTEEPVFLLRGQDVCAPGAVRDWAHRAQRIGADPEIVAMALDQAAAMEQWQRENARKVPGLTSTKPRTAEAVAIASATRRTITDQNFNLTEALPLGELVDFVGCSFEGVALDVNTVGMTWNSCFFENCVMPINLAGVGVNNAFHGLADRPVKLNP